MADPYPVVTIQPAWVLDEEGMGTKRKFWYRDPSTNVEWLFKYPREGTGEHWAEKVAAEIAGALGIDHATAELAVFQEQKGVAVRSFVTSGMVLVHGNQLMEISVDSYNPCAGFRYKRHTLANIWDCLGLLSRLAGSDLQATKRLFAELGDRLRRIRLEEAQVGAYVRRGRGGVYWSEDDTHAPGPLELFRRAAVLEPAIVLPALKRLEPVGEGTIRELVERVPKDWMSGPARDFASRLMEHSIEELRRIDV